MESLSAPMYLVGLGFKGKTVNGNETKVMVVTLRIEPFTTDFCEQLAPKVRTRIFSRDGNPNEDILTMDAAVHSGYLLVEFKMAPDQTRASLKLHDAELDTKVKIRRDKENPVYSALIKLESPYPNAKDLLMLANSVNSQFWVDVTESRPKLLEQAEDDDSPRGRGRQQRLPDEEDE